MAVSLSDEQKKFFTDPNFIHLAMLREDGSPQVAPIWADLDGDRVIFSTNEKSPKAAALKRDPRVALSILMQGDPYHELYARGRVVETRNEGGALINRLSRKYIGKDFPMPTDHQITFVVELDSVKAVKIPVV